MAGGTRSYEMARRMVAAGHEVHMITSRSDDRYPAGEWTRESIAGIQVHWLPVAYHNNMSYGRRLVAFTQFARKATTYASKLPADIIFATSTPLTIAIPGVRASRRIGVPLVFEVRDLWPELPLAMGALNYPFASQVAHRLEHWAYANSDQVVGLSPGMCEGVARTGYPADRIHCIPNSSDVELFHVADSAGEAFRAKREWLGSRPLVVYAGTFGRINGVSYLVDLAAHMRKVNPLVRFLAVGSGAEVDLVRNKARSAGVLDVNFFMENAIPKTEMPALFSAATVCTSLFIPLPAMWHNSANKFFDALAAGKPVAINYGGWQADLLARSGAGVQLDHADLEGAVRHLNALLSSEARLVAAAKASRELAHTHFSRDGLARRLIEVLEGAVSDRKQKPRLKKPVSGLTAGRWDFGP